MTAPWWQTAFGEHYSEVYAHRDDAAAASEVAALLPHLPRGPVLDAGCGAGRHLAALRAAGIPAVGFDYSGDLLAQARMRPGCRGHLARGDLRALPVAGDLSAVLLLFTVFGYFSDEQNAQVLRDLAGLLAPGGVLVLDLPAAERLRTGLVPESRRQTPRGELIERRRLVGQRVVKTVSLPGLDYEESVRLYEAGEVRDLASAAGLHAGDCWPGLGGTSVDQGRNVWWLWRRPLGSAAE